MNRIFEKIFSRKFLRNSVGFVGGLKVIGNSGMFYSDKMWYITFYNSYRNMVKAFKNLKLSVKIIHYVVSGKEYLVILTHGRSTKELINKLDSIRNVVTTAFPEYKMVDLTSREVDRILKWQRLDGEIYENVLVNFENLERYQGYKPSNLFKIPIQTSSKYNGRILLGSLIDDGEKYSIDLRDIENHLVCLGATGTGKTTTIATILNQLPSDIGYIVLDYHNEYTSLLRNYDLVIRPGDEELSLNPFYVEEDIEDNISLVTDIFSEIYGFTHSQAYFFRNVLEGTYNNFILVGEKEPNLKAFIRILEEYPIRSYSEHETKAALLRRFKQLLQGQGSKIFSGTKNLRLDEIMDKRVIIEIGSIKEVSMRRIFGYVLLKNIFNFQRDRGRKSIDHVTVLEEARYLIPTRRDFDNPSVAEKMVDEIRKFGESIFIISQFPSQISKAPIKNSGLVIIHRISGSEDLWYIKNVVSLNEDQLDYIKQLDVGEAVIKDSRNPLPFPVKIMPFLH